VNILGVNFGHDGTAALLSGGRIVAAVAEERLSRQKFHTGFPSRAILECLRIGGVSPDEVSVIALAGKFLPFEGREYLVDMLLDGNGGEDVFSFIPLRQLPSELVRVCLDPFVRRSKTLGPAARERVVAKFRALGFERASVEWFDHHLCHAASAYYTSGVDPALVITADQGGDWLSASVNVGRGGILRRLAGTSEVSLGALYSAVTEFLGFTPNRHEGKVTGLAAFGDPERCAAPLRACIGVSDDGRRFEGRLNLTALYGNGFLSKIRRRLSILRQALDRHWPSSAFAMRDQLHRLEGEGREDVAAAVQRVLEDVIAEHVDAMVRESGLRDIVLAGGVFSNVKVNQRVFERPGIRSIFIHPNMGDGGNALGAALLKWAEVCRGRGDTFMPFRLADVYFGREYSDDEIHRVLDRFSLKPEPCPDLEAAVARHVAEGRIVGLFQGRMEYGPRALGNRSILADPRDRCINDVLNRRLRRTEFMPFAPSTLEERAGRAYVGYGPGSQYAAQFMTITFPVSNSFAKEAPGVVHVDGTARPQVVSQEANPRFYRIIAEFEKFTGVPSVVNTSFNMHEEPIVCTPEDAVRAFLAGAVDLLAIGPWMVTR